MKKTMLVVSAIFMMGCSANYLENPQYIVKDPHFEGYQTKKDAIETRYLDKEITYAQYLEDVKALDQEYSKEVQHREDAIGQ
jgi:hypothetical protein